MAGEFTLEFVQVGCDHQVGAGIASRCLGDEPWCPARYSVFDRDGVAGGLRCEGSDLLVYPALGKQAGRLVL